MITTAHVDRAIDIGPPFRQGPCHDCITTQRGGVLCVDGGCAAPVTIMGAGGELAHDEFCMNVFPRPLQGRRRCAQVIVETVRIDQKSGNGLGVNIGYINPVPAPAAAAVLGMGGLVLTRRRR